MKRKCQAAITAVVLCLLVSACGKKGAENYLQLGKDHLAKGEISAAVIEFKNAATAQPDQGEVRYWLGVALRRSFDPPAAEIELRKALGLGYDPNKVQPELVRALIDRGALSMALDQITAKPVTDRGARAELMALKGDALLGLGKPDDARSAYEEAIKIDESDATGHMGLARLAIVERDLPKAVEIMDAVVARHPDDVPALLLKAGAEVRLGRLKAAAETYQNAIAVAPSDPRPHAGLIPIFVAEKNLGEAEAHLAALKKLVPGAAMTDYARALVSFVKHDMSQARDAIRRAIEASSDDPATLTLGGSIEFELGNYSIAEKDLSKAVSLSPEQVQPRRLLASTYVKLGQVDRASELLDKLQDRIDSHPETLILAGDIAYARKDYPKALGYFEKAAALNPKDSVSLVRIGQSYMLMGKPDLAVKSLLEATRVEPDKDDAYIELINLYAQLGKVDKALEVGDSLIERHPNAPLAFNARALAELAGQDTAAARKDFEKALELQPDNAAAALNLARLDLQDDRPDLAEKRYRAVLDKDPGQESVAIALANLMSATGRTPADIYKVLDAAIQVNPTSAALRVTKVDLALTNGDVKLATDTAEQASSVLPDSPEVLLRLGRVQAAAGEHSQALATYAKLGTVMPKSPASALGQAEVQVAEKNWTEARNAIDRAISIAPAYVPAYLARVDVGLKSRQFDVARKDAIRIRTKWPKIAAGYSAEAQVLVAEKRYAEAQSTLESGLSATRDPSLLHQLYLLLAATDRQTEADASVEKWLAQHPDDVKTMTVIGNAELSRADYPGAEKWYRRAEKVRPDDVTILNNLAWILGKQKKPEALEVGERAIKLAPRNGAVLDTVGRLYMEGGKFDRAVELLGEAVRLDPTSAATRVNFAKALIGAGQADKAKTELAAAKQLTQGSPLERVVDKLLAGQ